MAFDKILTNLTMFGSDASDSNGCSISNRIRSLALQNATSAPNGRFRRRSARNLVRDPGFRTTNVPAAPTFTTSYAARSLASILGRNVRCPPTFIPRRKTIRAILRGRCDDDSEVVEALCFSSLHLYIAGSFSCGGE